MLTDQRHHFSDAASTSADADGSMVHSASDTAQPVEAVDARELLRLGVVAIKLGDKQHGRRLLRESVKIDSQSEMAWLWLASVAETHEDALSYLQRVLEINPTHERALEWIKPAKRNLAQSLLARGVAAAKEGDTTVARNLLARSTEHDPTKEITWLWLASVTEAAEEKLLLLERALDLNPSNEQARVVLQNTRISLARTLTQRAAATLVMTGDRESARKLVERARAFDEGLEDAWLLSARLTDDPKERAAYLRRALEINPASSPAAPMLETSEVELAAKTPVELAAKSSVHSSAQVPIVETHAPNLEIVLPEAEAASSSEADTAQTHSVSVMQSTHRTMQSKRRTIMVVDDSPTVRKLVTIKLEKEGHRVVPAVDGKDALAKLNDEVPDLILTDITMPRMDGYQLCKLVRNDETTKHVPVIMLSGKDGFFDKVRGRMAGSTAYITKPFEPETLLKIVEEYCDLST